MLELALDGLVDHDPVGAREALPQAVQRPPTPRNIAELLLAGQLSAFMAWRMPLLDGHCDGVGAHAFTVIGAGISYRALELLELLELLVKKCWPVAVAVANKDRASHHREGHDRLS